MAANPPHLADPDVNPSFTKSIFLGELREELLLPFPRLSTEDAEAQRMIVDSFRSWADGAVDARQHDHDGKFADGVREGMAELGLMGLNIPEAYGGFGASAKVFNRVFGEIGATDAAQAEYFGAHQTIGCKGIVLFGTDEQTQRWLPRWARLRRFQARHTCRKGRQEACWMARSAASRRPCCAWKVLGPR